MNANQSILLKTYRNSYPLLNYSRLFKTSISLPRLIKVPTKTKTVEEPIPTQKGTKKYIELSINNTNYFENGVLYFSLGKTGLDS